MSGADGGRCKFNGGISFNAPPNVPMAVRTVLAIGTECFDVMERPASKKAVWAGRCCAGHDPGRPILAITPIPARNTLLECLLLKSLQLLQTRPRAERKLVDCTSSSYVVLRRSQCDLGSWPGCCRGWAGTALAAYSPGASIALENPRVRCEEASASLTRAPLSTESTMPIQSPG